MATVRSRLLEAIEPVVVAIEEARRVDELGNRSHGATLVAHDAADVAQAEIRSALEYASDQERRLGWAARHLLLRIRADLIADLPARQRAARTAGDARVLLDLRQSIVALPDRVDWRDAVTVAGGVGAKDGASTR